MKTSLEQHKQTLMDKLSEVYFAALELKSDAEEQAAHLETVQEGIYSSQEDVVHLVSLLPPVIFSALATLEEIPAKFPVH